MPCGCRGVQFKVCSCNMLRSGPWGTEPVFVTPGCLRYQASSLKVWLMRIVEGFYERCAAYNLRYCPYRTFTGSKNSGMRTLRDVVVLAFFLIANLVVFLSILTRITMHMSCAIVESGNWIKRSLCSSSSCADDTAGPLSPTYEMSHKPRLLNCS